MIKYSQSHAYYDLLVIRAKFIDNLLLKNNDEFINMCYECKSDLIVEDQSNGCVLCQNCGQVIDVIIDNSSDWKHLNENVDIYNHSNVLFPQSSIGTTISGGRGTIMKMIHNWQKMPYKERSLSIELKKIGNICAQTNMFKSVEDDAKLLCKMVNECKKNNKYVITRGKNRISTSAACLYFACLKRNVSRAPKEIAKLYDIKLSELNTGIKNVRKLINTDEIINHNMCSPIHFIKRFCNNLNILTCNVEKIINVTNNVEKLNIVTEHNPYSIAAACILLVSDIYNFNNITRKKIATEFNISGIIINRTYKKIEQYKSIVVDNDKTEKEYQKMNIIDNVIPNEIIEKIKLFNNI